jgi:hypothetical protein
MENAMLGLFGKLGEIDLFLAVVCGLIYLLAHKHKDMDTKYAIFAIAGIGALRLISLVVAKIIAGV